MLNLAKRSDRRFVSTLEVVGLAEFQPRVSIIRIKPDGFAIVPHFFFGSSGEHAAYVIFEGVQANGSNAGYVLVLRHREVGVDETKQIPGQRNRHPSARRGGRGWRAQHERRPECPGDRRLAGVRHGWPRTRPENLVAHGRLLEKTRQAIPVPAWEKHSRRESRPWCGRRRCGRLRSGQRRWRPERAATSRKAAKPQGRKQRRVSRQVDYIGRETAHHARRCLAGTECSVVPSASGEGCDLG